MSTLKLIDAVKNRYAQAGALVATSLVSASAFAQAPAPTTLDTVIDAMVAQILAGVGTVFGKIVPLLVLVYGMAFAVKWVRKAGK